MPLKAENFLQLESEVAKREFRQTEHMKDRWPPITGGNHMQSLRINVGKNKDWHLSYSQQGNRELRPTNTLNWILPATRINLEADSIPKFLDKVQFNWHLNFCFVRPETDKPSKPTGLLSSRAVEKINLSWLQMLSWWQFAKAAVVKCHKAEMI